MIKLDVVAFVDFFLDTICCEQVLKVRYTLFCLQGTLIHNVATSCQIRNGVYRFGTSLTPIRVWNSIVVITIKRTISNEWTPTFRGWLHWCAGRFIWGRLNFGGTFARQDTILLICKYELHHWSFRYCSYSRRNSSKPDVVPASGVLLDTFPRSMEAWSASSTWSGASVTCETISKWIRCIACTCAFFSKLIDKPCFWSRTDLRQSILQQIQSYISMQRTSTFWQIKSLKKFKFSFSNLLIQKHTKDILHPLK